MPEKTTNAKSFFDKTHLYLHKQFGVRVRAEIARDLIGHAVKNRAVLDAGCGDGGVTAQFAHEASQLHLVDISEKMLALAKAKALESRLERMRFINSDIEKVETGQQYDLVVAFGLIMHVRSPISTLQKLHGLLVPGGFLLVQFTNCEHPISRFNRWANPSGSGWVNTFSEKSFLAMALQCGFKVEKKLRYSWLLSGLGRLPDALLYRFHKWTYKNRWASRFGMDCVYLLEK
jgi:2-polyprenyl-3-methyl-5-hydroxy-6-metoxy-1,4-benzoquinol methylase